MNTKQFQYVLTLAHEGSFSRAADVLNITQPSLSQYVKKIEKEIGTELFTRTNGDVRITDAGRIYIEAGRRILDIEHQMENAFNDIAECKTGSLIVGTSPYRSASMMPMVAAKFKALHPNMVLVIREATTAELLDGMEQGEFDLAVTLLPVDEKRFSHEELPEEEIVLAVPAAWEPFEAAECEGRRYPAVSTAILRKYPLVMITETQYMQRQVDDLLYDGGRGAVPAVVVKSLEAQIEMVKAGVGMAVVPCGARYFCPDGSVVFYSFSDQLLKRKPAVIRRKGVRLSKTAQLVQSITKAVSLSLSLTIMFLRRLMQNTVRLQIMQMKK